MFRIRLSLAFAALVALVFVQAAIVYLGANRVYDYAQHSRLASDILSELVELSANKQRLRVWASQRLMNADASFAVRDDLLTRMQASAAVVKELAARDVGLWTSLAARDGTEVPVEVQELVGMTELLDDNIVSVRARLLQLAPLEPHSEFATVWSELNQVFDLARGRDLRELVNGAIARQRRAVPIARAATEHGLVVLRQQAIAVALVTLAAAVLMSLHLKRRLQRPLDRLLAGTQALQAGALDHRVATGSHDEFDRVAEHFNAMAAELQQHRIDADAARRRLEEAVQARTLELSAAHDTLQRIDARRRQLFADLGHELRTPATAIRGEAEIALRGGDKPAAEYQQTLIRVVNAVQQLARVTDDLLLIARAEADQLAIRPTAVDLLALLGDAAEQAMALAESQGVEVLLEPATASAPLTVLADPDRLRQALMIVLDNAVRYSHPGGSVHIAWNANGDTVEIVVQDEGIGIAPDELGIAFERFERGSRARAHRADGTGIGLSIAQAIVHAHRGRIELQSEPGAGTRVRIALPRPSADPTEAGRQGTA